MGFLSDIWDDITGKSAAEASERAANVQADHFRQSLELLRPFFEDSAANLEGVNNDATMQGFGQNLGEILSGRYFGDMIGERKRAADAQLSQAGLRRSGAAATTAANNISDLGLMIEQTLANRRANNAGRAMGATTQAGGILGNIGGSLAGGIIGANNAGQSGLGNILKIGSGLLGGLFNLSDERLKENIRKVDTLGDLDVISWDWNDEAYNRFGLKGSSKGFSAQQVKEKYPQYASELEGFLVVDYDGLLDEVTNVH